MPIGHVERQAPGKVIRIVPRPEPTATQIGALRRICGLGIGEIRAAAASQASIRDVIAFGSDWEERMFLRDLSRWYDKGNAPFAVHEIAVRGRGERLSPAQFVALLKHYRAIELEQQMLSDLECGYIASHASFRPHDEDWLPSHYGVGP